jgi:Protein of unknown function (DUF3631)
LYRIESTGASPQSPITDNQIDREVEIERLANLESIDYEVTRTEAATDLGVRASWLDQAVKKKRRALGLESTSGDPGQGRAVKIDDVLPWHEAIDGDRLATLLAVHFKKYVGMSDEAADTAAIWTMHTFGVNHFTISPRLAWVSPTKGCGKTTALRVLSHLVRRPKRAGSISPAALFRAVEQFQPTILLDETEKYIEHSSDLHALLNEGHCKGGTVLRVLGDKFELCEFSIFGAVAFARNGKLPDDLEQRSIVIELQRRRANEQLSELRDDRAEDLRDLARMCARWTDDCGAEVGVADPDMGGLINRTADNWRPLFAIADKIGSDWPVRIREAAAALAPRESDSIGPVLLADIRAALDGKATDRLASADLCEALAAMEGHPWPEYGRTGKPITPNQLAKLLRPFGIVTNLTIRLGSKTAKGYSRHQFEELWVRYLAPEGVNDRSHSNNADEMGTSVTFQRVTAESDVTDGKCEKPPSNGHCYRVTDENPENAPSRDDTTVEGHRCAQCGEDGADVDALGDGSAWVHRRCEEDWLFDHPDAGLTIPPDLRREVVA